MMLSDPFGPVRLAAASNLADRPALHPIAAASQDASVRGLLAATYALDDDSRSLDRGIQVALAEDPSTEPRAWIAQTTAYLDLFEMLLRDDDPTVRGSCAANPRITREQMQLLVEDRIAKTRRLAVAFGLRYPDDDQLIRLASDRSAEVRWAVLFRVDAPRRAVEIIADDTDEMNRRHAQGFLDGKQRLYSNQVIEFWRDRRARAERGLQFVGASAR